MLYSNILIRAEGGEGSWEPYDEGVPTGFTTVPTMTLPLLGTLIPAWQKIGAGVNIWKSEAKPGIYIPGIEYVDDAMTPVRNRKRLRLAVQALDQWAGEKRFKVGIAPTKTAYLRYKHHETEEAGSEDETKQRGAANQAMEIQGTDIQQVETYKYLAIPISGKGGYKMLHAKRIGRAMQLCTQLDRTPETRNISLAAVTKIIKVAVRTSIDYGMHATTVGRESQEIEVNLPLRVVIKRMLPQLTKKAENLTGIEIQLGVLPSWEENKKAALNLRARIGRLPPSHIAYRTMESTAKAVKENLPGSEHSWWGMTENWRTEWNLGKHEDVVLDQWKARTELKAREEAVSKALEHLKTNSKTRDLYEDRTPKELKQLEHLETGTRRSQQWAVMLRAGSIPSKKQTKSCCCAGLHTIVHAIAECSERRQILDEQAKMLQEQLHGIGWRQWTEKTNRGKAQLILNLDTRLQTDTTEQTMRKIKWALSTIDKMFQD